MSKYRTAQSSAPAVATTYLMPQPGCSKATPGTIRSHSSFAAEWPVSNMKAITACAAVLKKMIAMATCTTVGCAKMRSSATISHRGGVGPAV